MSRSRPARGAWSIVIVGFIDPNAPDVIAQPQNPTKVEVAATDENAEEEEEGDEDGGDTEEEAVDTGPDPVEAAAASPRSPRGTQVLPRSRSSAPRLKTLRQRKKLQDEFMELRLSPRMFDALT